MAPGSTSPTMVQAALGAGVAASSEAALEEELRKQCADLEQKLRQDDLYFQNETLEVQLVQMQDDFESLKKDFTSMCTFLERQRTEKKEQLEEQTRAATSAEGHADCLNDLLHFHEENGQLVSSYWRAQCEKRDGSTGFLTLKLQEYTVPSAEYWARKRISVDSDSAVEQRDTSEATPASSSSSPAEAPPSSSSAAANPSGAPLPSIGQSYQTLLDQHHELLREHQELEDESLAMTRDLETSELNRTDLQARIRYALGQQQMPTSREEPTTPSPRHAAALEASLEAECSRLRSETEACQQALASANDRAAAGSSSRGRLPAWAHRCTWRDELDVRAAQLERISLQFDATKRSLDAANEELQWQATSAEALRMRLADVLRAIQSEETKTSELHAEHQQSQREVEELLNHWPSREAATLPGGQPDSDAVYRGLPLVCQQAHWLLETIRRGGAARAAAATESSQPSAEALAAAAVARLPEEAQAGAVRLTLL